MSGDFARVSFNPDRHYTRVLLQQGRVLLEADFNEQSALHHHYLRMLIVDLAGRAWRAGAQAFDLTEPGEPAQAADCPHSASARGASMSRACPATTRLPATMRTSRSGRCPTVSWKRRRTPTKACSSTWKPGNGR